MDGVEQAVYGGKRCEQQRGADEAAWDGHGAQCVDRGAALPPDDPKPSELMACSQFARPTALQIARVEEYRRSDTCAGRYGTARVPRSRTASGECDPLVRVGHPGEVFDFS